MSQRSQTVPGTGLTRRAHVDLCRVAGARRRRPS
ncbi:putative leader peptide [Streptosporangium album]